MAKYMKETIVDAIQYKDLSEESINELIDFCGDSIYISDGVVCLIINHKDVVVPVGSYIIADEILGFTLCDEIVFNRLYKPVEE